MKRRLLAAAIAVSLLCALTACGGDKEVSADGAETITGSKVTETGSRKSGGTVENREYTIKEWLDTGATCILYYVSERDPNPGKDETPSTIFVFKDGTCSKYNSRSLDLTFGDLSKMTDDEIVSYYEEKFAEGDYESHEYDFQNHSYEIAVYTDSTGNTVEYETIVVEPAEGGASIGHLTHLMPNYVTGQATVYESDYQVIVHKDNKSTLWYRYGEDTIQGLTLDGLDTDGIMVDPDEDYD